MSCRDCEIAQSPDPTNPVTGLKVATYVRVGNANVLVSGCGKHLAELIDLVNEGLKSYEEAEEE